MVPPANPAPAPRDEYAARLAAGRRDVARHRRLATRLSSARLAVFALGAFTAWGVFGSNVVAGPWLTLPVVVFAILVVLHDRTLAEAERCARRVRFYEAGIARLDGTWPQHGNAGERFRDPQHPYAEDLDLFGSGSLFELLCQARTRAGEECLAGWLKAPAPAAVVAERQAAVAELSPRLDWREDLARLGEAVEAGLHPDALRSWGEAPGAAHLRALRLAAAGFATTTLLTAAAWWLSDLGPELFEVALLAQSVFAVSVRGRVRRTLAAVEEPCRDLTLFAGLLARIEGEEVRSPRLVELQRALEVEERKPSERIARLRRLLDLLDARRNQLFAPIGALLLWSTQLAFAVEAWRAVCGRRLGPWIDAGGEFEALSSLACLHYEQPGFVFPELLEGEGRFEAEALGHPLLPGSRCVTNDVRLGGELRLLVVSGSNMSGKSTLLRSVGVNAVLAQAGSPVAARRLVISPLEVAASIRILDSLLDGSSHFYAEIVRLRQIMGMTGGPVPVLFLVDEILHGTNSHDRGIGAEAVVRALVERGALGLVTTHDLALARVADALAPQARNVHFEDHLEDAAIAFDYRLRPGVVEKSNALALMRAVGLDV
jgi:hypothetical protein